MAALLQGSCDGDFKFSSSSILKGFGFYDGKQKVGAGEYLFNERIGECECRRHGLVRQWNCATGAPFLPNPRNLWDYVLSALEDLL